MCKEASMVSGTLQHLLDWIQCKARNNPNLGFNQLSILHWLSGHGVDENCTLYKSKMYKGPC